MKKFITKIELASDFIKSKTKLNPSIAIILGSGLGDFANEIDIDINLSYEEIPNFPVSTVVGHHGKLIVGLLNKKPILAMQGRFHFYEGYPITDVTFPVRVMKKLGIEKLILTNAAGAVNLNFSPGDLMIIKDHINFSGTNPLIGKNLESFGPRFPDLSYTYDLNFRNILKDSAKELGIPLQEGVYLCNSGPSYETPAEIRMIRVLGGDAVGMSTVPEAIIANHSGIKVLGISCITNMAAGILNQPLTHDEVIETSNNVKVKFIKLLKNFINKI